MASGIEKFIQKVCVQTAVYWGTPVENGFGSKTFATPVEILVRWTDKKQIIKTGDGKEIVSVAEVLVQQDLDFGGLLYLGALADFTPLQLSTPFDIQGAYEIRKIDKIPMIKSTTVFVRTVYLSSRSNLMNSF